MRLIPLTQGKLALVDDQDYPTLSIFKWYAKQDGTNWYAARNCKVGNKRRTVSMHQQLLGPTTRLIDHRDRNGLNNQRDNLRFATRKQNSWNSEKPRGCWFKKSRKRWVSEIRVGDRRFYLGSFETAREAQIIYEKARATYHGDFAP